MFLSFVVVYNKRTEDKEQALPKSTHLSIRRPPTFFYNLSARPPLGQHSQASVDSPLQSLALRNSLAYYTSETTVEGKPALSKKDKKKLGADALYKESERPALSLSFVEASCGLAPGLSESSPHLPMLPFEVGDIKIHASGRSAWAGYPDATGERQRNTTPFTHTLVGKAARQRVPRADGEAFGSLLPRRVGLLCRIRRGLVHNLGDFQPLAQHTHTHSYSSSSLFRSTDGHTPRDHSPWRRRKREETRGVASVLV